VLGRKFDWPEGDVAQALLRIDGYTERVKVLRSVTLVIDDPDDDRILECALAARSRYIVTGDKHLLKLFRFESIQIVRVAEFLDIFLKNEVALTQ
jgi:predicted nucleic acid-binding protein